MDEKMRLTPSSVPNLDLVLGGGFPAYSMNIIGGKPGTGKTILAEQMIMGLISRNRDTKALYLTTLSEPMIKVVRYVQQFSFFDEQVFDEQVIYQDIGSFVRDHSLAETLEHINNLVTKHKPEILVIDSFRGLGDAREEPGEFRRFCYELSYTLAAARCTTFLVGEYSLADMHEAVFAVADGVILLDIIEQAGEQRRTLQVHKLRGRAPAMERFPFKISSDGISVLKVAPVALEAPEQDEWENALPTGIRGLDDILKGGLARGRAYLLSGTAGSGKTTCALQFIVEGARRGEKGLFISFAETPAQLIDMGAHFGWNLGEFVEQGLVQIVYIPLTEIRVEENMEQLVQVIETMGPHRVAMDSYSLFLHRVHDPHVQREKLWQLRTLLERVGATGIFISDQLAGEENKISRYGVEETQVDGVILLFLEAQGMKRRRYAEVYKLRGAAQTPGRHRMEITRNGIEVFYAKREEVPLSSIAPPLSFSPIEAIVSGDLRYGSSWLVRGDQGTGKSTLAYQFCTEGLKNEEAVIFIAVDTPSYQVARDLSSWGVSLESFVKSNKLRILDTHPTSGASYLDLTDMERFLFEIERHLQAMPRPCRVIIDSLTPFALQYRADDFAAFIEQKNRSLRQIDVTLFDTILPATLEISIMYGMVNSFDVVIDIFVPDWGEMRQAGEGSRALQVKKARGSAVDSRAYPYSIDFPQGVVVKSEFYGKRRAGPQAA